MKKFKITYNVGEFTVPEFDDDEEYDEPDEIKEKYIINRDCQD